VLRLVIGGRTVVLARMPRFVVPRTHEQGVADNDPAPVRGPACFDHQCARQVASGRRYQGVGRAEAKAARAAVENLMRVLSIEWARYGITLNAIAVGQFGTETMLTKYPQPIVDSMVDSIPAGRLGRAEEVAWLVAYLASPAGDFVSGTVLTIDGARDNWLGRWPPAPAADAEGRPLAEAQRRRDES